MEPILRETIALVCRVGEITELDPADDFYAAGLESVRALEVLLELETTFNVTIPDDIFIQCRNANDLAAMITKLQGQTA